MGISLTCFASHQTVAERDLCRVVPIYQWASYLSDPAEFRGARLEVHSARMGWGSAGWQAIGEFIPVVAQERGRLELRMSTQSRRQVARLLRHLLANSPKVLPENGHGHKEFDLAAFMEEKSPELQRRLSQRSPREHEATEFDPSFDDALSACFVYVYEACVHGHLYVADVRGRLRPMEFALLHEDAYQALVERKRTTPWYGTPPVDVPAAITAAFEGAYQDVPVKEDESLGTRFIRAGRVTDELTKANDLTRSLHELRMHLNALAVAVFEGTLTLAAATEMMQGDVEGVYAFASLDDLGVALSPVVCAADEDYDNHCGTAYVDFVSKVNRSVQRSRSVAIHGEFFRYELYAASLADVGLLKDDATTWDCGFALVSAEPVPGDATGRLLVVLEVTAGFDFVQRVLEDINLPFMHESVKLVA